MPVTSSSVPPKGRRISICSSDSGKTTHSRPRALTSDPTAKLILASLICSNTATPHPEGDRMLPDRQGDRPTPPQGRPQGSQPRINPTPALTKIRRYSSTPRSLCKGGSGVERSGDPCGRPGEGLGLATIASLLLLHP